ncbi:MAG: BglII/BstYI family type II restriction endonuclease [Pseudomonadota bacterium]
MFHRLRRAGFDLAMQNHAGAILAVDFPQAEQELEDALLALRIPVDELIRGGGGEALSTQRLRNALAGAHWRKHEFVIQTIVDGEAKEATSHEIDHVRRLPAGVVALEIEWNNKDPFFDRDLENFQRLHAGGAISVGIVVTRGATLQANIEARVRARVADTVEDFDQLIAAFDLEPTRRQRDAVLRRMETQGVDFATAWANRFVADKFGSATTHWAKLETRIARGVGNPCPLVLIGIPDRVLD